MIVPAAFGDSLIVALFGEGYIQHTYCLCHPAKYAKYMLPGLMSTAFTTVAQKCNTWRLDQLATNYHLNLSVLFDPFATEWTTHFSVPEPAVYVLIDTPKIWLKA